MDAPLEARADVEARNRIGRTRIHRPAYDGNCDALLALLRHNADADARNGLWRRPLVDACSFLQQEAADLLLRWDADETSVDHHGLSAENVIRDGIKDDDRQARGGDVERCAAFETRSGR